MQSDFVQLMRQIAPDLAREMATRALVVERVAAMAPVGRRQLAMKLDMPEREIRAAAAVLKDEGIIQLNASGMALTQRGSEVLAAAQEFCHAMFGLSELESQIAGIFGLGRVCIVGGNADEDPQVLQDVGRLAAQRLKGMLHSRSTLAVTGGSTIAAVAQHMQSSAPLNVMVVPARGALGRSVQTQANTLAAEFAQKLGGHHRLLHLPDHIDAAALQEMLKLPDVREAIELLQRADVVLHGIGRADDTAAERKLPVTRVRKLTEGGAVAEALGSYYDRNGECLLSSSSVGVDPGQLKPTCQMVAVAAGKRKAEAISAVVKRYRHALLVTDEAAAREMLRLALKEDCTPQ